MLDFIDSTVVSTLLGASEVEVDFSEIPVVGAVTVAVRVEDPNEKGDDVVACFVDIASIAGVVNVLEKISSVVCDDFCETVSDV